MVVPVVGADTTGEVGDAAVGDDEEVVEELDPGSGPEVVELGPVL
jgi:hypothetical protein